MGLKQEKFIFFSFLVWLAVIVSFFFIITDTKTDIKIKLYNDLYEILDIVYASCHDESINLEHQGLTNVTEEYRAYNYKIEKVLEPYDQQVTVSIDLSLLDSGGCRVEAQLEAVPFGPDEVRINEAGQTSFFYTKELIDNTGYIEYAATGSIGISGTSCESDITSTVDLVINKGVVKKTEKGKISLDEPLDYNGPLYCEDQAADLLTVLKTYKLKKVIEKGDEIYVIFDHDFILKSNNAQNEK